jgi:RNA polymerase sigma factor (sigma-70 family)
MDDPRQLLLDEWKTLERTIAFTCRRFGLSRADADDFASVVKIKLIEKDFAIIRRFRGESKLSTYLKVVVQRAYADYCLAEIGKWHPSAEATKAGPVALRLEFLLYRRGLNMDEAFRQLTAEYSDLTRTECEALAGRLPTRQQRRPPVSLDEVSQPLHATEDADLLVIAHERQQVSNRASAVIREYLLRLNEQDRLMLQLHFESGMALSQIAKYLDVEQKPLYRRRERLLQELRLSLETDGITAGEVLDLVGHLPIDGVDFGLRQNDSPAPEHGAIAETEHPR